MNTNDHQMEDLSAAVSHPDIIGQAELIKDLLEKAKEHGLEVEVITWALKTMQVDPSLEPYEAFGLGYQEWVK